MTNVRVLFISFCMIFTLLHTSVRSEELSFVFYQPNASFKDNVEAVTAIRSLEKWLSNELKITVKGNFFQKEADMERFIQESKPHFVFLDIRYFIANYKSKNMQPILVPIRQNSNSTRVVVIVRKDSNIRTIFDLEGKTLATTKTGNININYLSNVVFEKLIDVGSYFKMKLVDTSNSAIMAVSYKEADVAIIDQIIFDTKLPQKSDFNVLFTSTDIIFPPLCVFPDRIKPGQITLLKNAFISKSSSPEASDFHNALGIDGWKEADFSMYRDIEKLLTTPKSNLVKDGFLTASEGMRQTLEAIPPEYKADSLLLYKTSP